MRPLPTITVIICARNAAGHLVRSIPAAMGQDYPSWRYKVLVVDNGSSDDTADVARRLGAAVRQCPRPGVARARQYGWKIARSELVAYLDADCEPPSTWLPRLVNAFEKDQKLGAAGVRLMSAQPRTLAERHIIEARVLDTDRFWSTNALQWPFLVTAGMIVRRQALGEVGGFDLQLGTDTGEDADLCWRLERAGWRVRYDPSVEIVHHHRATIEAMARQVYWYGRSSSALFARWREELGWRRFTDWGPYRRLAAGLLWAVPSLLSRKEPYDRWRPLLEALDAAAFLSGKWEGAVKNGVLFL